MFLLAQSFVPWHRQQLNSLSHLDIFILMKTAINFATQTPTFMETRIFYLLSWHCPSFGSPCILGGDNSGAGKRNPPSGCPPSARPSALESYECHTGMKTQVWGGKVYRNSLDLASRASSLTSRVHRSQVLRKHLGAMGGTKSGAEYNP